MVRFHPITMVFQFWGIILRSLSFLPISYCLTSHHCGARRLHHQPLEVQLGHLHGRCLSTMQPDLALVAGAGVHLDHALDAVTSGVALEAFWLNFVDQNRSGLTVLTYHLINQIIKKCIYMWPCPHDSRCFWFFILGLFGLFSRETTSWYPRATDGSRCVWDWSCSTGLGQRSHLNGAHRDEESHQFLAMSWLQNQESHVVHWMLQDVPKGLNNLKHALSGLVICPLSTKVHSSLPLAEAVRITSCAFSSYRIQPLSVCTWPLGKWIEHQKNYTKIDLVSICMPKSPTLAPDIQVPLHLSCFPGAITCGFCLGFGQVFLCPGLNAFQGFCQGILHVGRSAILALHHRARLPTLRRHGRCSFGRFGRFGRGFFADWKSWWDEFGTSKQALFTYQIFHPHTYSAA